jgi:hypothetical protein
VIRNNEAYVRCGDIIKTLYVDLADATDDVLKKYLRAQIEVWEDYEIGILRQYNNNY